MATSVLIPLDVYLNTSYRPDREYIDGELVERNLGKWEHSRIQAYLAWWFIHNEPVWKFQAATEWRTQVSRTRVRIPDLVLVPLGPQDAVLANPPILIVEILSPNDTYSEVEERARDYQQMGVRTVWIVDPQTRTGRVCSGSAWIEAERLEVAETPIHVELPGLFAALGPSEPRG